MPNLRISEGGRQVLHQIERDVVTIGRAPSNTITIQDGQRFVANTKVVDGKNVPDGTFRVVARFSTCASGWSHSRPTTT